MNRSSTESVFNICPYQFSGIGFTLNGVSYTNNSIVTITEIGTGSAALLCTTTLPGCCFSTTGGINGWFLPNGREVMNSVALPYYRTRAYPTGRLILHRSTGTTTGIFRCDIPAASGVVQSLYVGIYNNNTGESCTLSGWLFIFKEMYSTSAKAIIFQAFVYTLNSI